jgi:hypothetical protein
MKKIKLSKVPDLLEFKEKMLAFIPNSDCFLISLLCKDFIMFKFYGGRKHKKCIVALNCLKLWKG